MTSARRTYLSLPATALPRWSTTSVGDSADTQPGELSALGEHVTLCRAGGSRYAALLRGAQAVHHMVAARFVTTLVVVVVVMGTLLVVF